jgi:chromate transporter
MPDPLLATPVTPCSLFVTWLGLGARSWGGGAATLLMIRRTVVEDRGWMSGDEFTHAWGICQVTPGINLLGLTVLIGWRVGRAWGAALALLGLLLPSVTITAALTAAYAAVRELPAMQAALRGVVPATVGLGLLLSWQMGAPLVRQARAESRASLLVAVGLLGGAALAQLLWRPPVLAVLLGAGAIGALYGWLRARLAARRAPHSENL